MTQLYTRLFTFIALTMLFSCGGGEAESNLTSQQETPKALQNDRIALKSFGRSGRNLTEELYAELVDKSPELKKLENDLEALNPQRNDQIEKFDAYESQSDQYYLSANNQAKAITDSLLRKKIITLLQASSHQYANQTAGHQSLLKLISQTGTTLNDHHAVLKIVLTLPLIEKFQHEHLPDKKGLKELINEQEKLIKRTDSLTPKF